MARGKCRKETRMKIIGTIKNWVKLHQTVTAVIAAVVVVGVGSAIVLPIALSQDRAQDQTEPTHTHFHFSEEWTYDDESHWHACTGEDCDGFSNKASHVYDNACDAICNVCGAERTPEPHVYDNACDIDCNVCGAARASTVSHTFGAWTVQTPADYGVNRVEKRVCSECSHEETQEIPKSSFEYTGDFYMVIRDTWTIPNVGVAVTGKVGRGTVSVDDRLTVGESTAQYTVLGLDVDRTEVSSATYGDEVSILFGTGLTTATFTRGQFVAKPDTVELKNTFTAEIYLYTTEESGRTAPIFSTYRPTIVMYNGDVEISGTITLPDDMTYLAVGETATVTITLATPTWIVEGMEFTAKESTTTVISGTVLSVV